MESMIEQLAGCDGMDSDEKWDHYWNCAMACLKATVFHLEYCGGQKYAQRVRMDQLMSEVRQLMLRIHQVSCVCP